MARRNIAVDPAFAARLRELRTARGMSYRDFDTISRSYVYDLESGRKRPTPEIAAALDAALDAGGELVRLVMVQAPSIGPIVVADDDLDEIEALELARRIAASDVGEETVRRLEGMVDELATRYSATPPAQLLRRVRRYLTYSSHLLDHSVRKTLDEHRRLVVVSAWLSMLAATLHIDLKQSAVAEARLVAAASLARHAGDREIQAWVLETRAWSALTEGDYPTALRLAQAGQGIAPRGSSVAIQAIAQEGRAWARLGRADETYDAIKRVDRLVSPLPRPGRPEHHYRYDPGKATAYVATTLAWVGDPAAEGYAREVIAHLGGAGGRPRRMAVAQVDLGLALVAAHRPDEAVGVTQAAILSGRIVPSNQWRALEVVTALEATGAPEAVQLREAYEALRRGELTPRAQPTGPDVSAGD
ncbi:MAG TPA: helix-turn-helix transcriptional regulator [Acidimicrobiales bacterium]